MSDWILKVNNIGKFKEDLEIELVEGLNWIIGENATGKTSLVNSIKLLNQMDFEKNEDDEDLFTYQDFLHDKTQSGYVLLENQKVDYVRNILSPVINITSYLKGKIPKIKKEPNKLITDDHNIIKFSFIDKSNKLMESIEYSGTINLIKKEIVKISKIKYYELMLGKVKALHLEYIERKEREVKRLNNERKEIELNLKENIFILNNLQNELNKIQFSEELTDELKKLKENRENKNSLYNSIYFGEVDKLNENYNKIIATLEKDGNILKELKNKRSELSDFIDLRDSIIENEKKLKTYDNTLFDIKKEKENLNLEKYNVQKQISYLEETRELDDKSKICKYCLNIIDLIKIKEKLNELFNSRTELNEKIKNLNIKYKEINRDREYLNNLIINQKNIPKQIADLSSRINQLEKKIDLNEKKKINFKNKINEKFIVLEEIQKEIEEINQKFIELSSVDDNLKEEQTNIINKVKSLRKKNDIFTSKKNLLIQKILILPENFKKLIQRAETLINVINKEVEAFYIDFIDFINSELKELINKLKWNFEKVYIDDNLNLIVRNNEGKTLKFKSLSNFEKKSIGILIILIIKMKYYPDYPLFVIDEHLNSADFDRLLNFIFFLYENFIILKIPFFIITSLPFENKSNKLEELYKKQFNDLTIFYKK